MARKNIPLVTGEKYHIFNRGVDKRDVFLDQYDYLRFYQSLAFFNTIEPTVNYRLAKSSYTKQNEKKLVNIEAYSLLPNHFHLIVEQIVDGGISEFLKRVSGGYTSYFNEKYQRSGVLFQGRYKKVHVNTDEQYQYLFAYVNENHIVHRLSHKRELFHSSSIHYQKLAISKIIDQVRSDPYNFVENKKLAEQIYQKRKSMKDLLET
ncbi:MAG: transposase [Candidatus Pacebacteria bacterium]|jgi:putative transposase|nr:transposase [Candidatus Paceibacterota bacterium]